MPRRLLVMDGDVAGAEDRTIRFPGRLVRNQVANRFLRDFLRDALFDRGPRGGSVTVTSSLAGPGRHSTRCAALAAGALLPSLSDRSPRFACSSGCSMRSTGTTVCPRPLFPSGIRANPVARPLLGNAGLSGASPRTPSASRGSHPRHRQSKTSQSIPGGHLRFYALCYPSARR